MDVGNRRRTGIRTPPGSETLPHSLHTLTTDRRRLLRLLLLCSDIASSIASCSCARGELTECEPGRRGPLRSWAQMATAQVSDGSDDLEQDDLGQSDPEDPKGEVPSVWLRAPR